MLREYGSKGMMGRAAHRGKLAGKAYGESLRELTGTLIIVPERSRFSIFRIFLTGGAYRNLRELTGSYFTTQKPNTSSQNPNYC